MSTEREDPAGMTVAVTTPTGNVGRHVVRGLLRAGLRPRVLVRDASRLEPEVRDHVDAVEVDQHDGDAVLAATRGVDALYWVSPLGESEDPAAEHEEAGRHAARAVTENGIGRVVFQSSGGAELRGGAGEIDGLARVEQLLEATDAAVLHLRCGFFFTNLLLQIDAVRAGTVPVLVPTDRPQSWVAPRDIAEIGVLGLLAPPWTGRRVQGVHGPRDLSWDEAAAIVTEVSGHRVVAERIADDEMRQMLLGTGMGPGQVEAMLGMSIGTREGFVPEQQRDVTTTTPTTLSSWVFDELRPVLAEG